jgi:hypothetical protein
MNPREPSEETQLYAMRLRTAFLAVSDMSRLLSDALDRGQKVSVDINASKGADGKPNMALGGEIRIVFDPPPSVTESRDVMSPMHPSSVPNLKQGKKEAG